MTFGFIIVYALTLHSHTSSSQKSYPFESWMNDFPSSLHFYNNTIFDVVFPGSRQSGMVQQDILDTASSSTNNYNGFSYSRISSLSSTDQKAWSARQETSVLKQLRGGVRFLDLQFEENNGKYYAYNGLLGVSVDEIIDNIEFFIQEYGSDEIIILYLSSFFGNDLQTLYDTFTNAILNAKMVPNSMDLTTNTLQDLRDDGYNVIAFSDDLSTSNPPNTFYDSSIYLHIKSTSDSNVTLGSMEEVHQVRTFVTSNLRKGWPSHTLNMIYWTLDIAQFGLFKQRFDYTSFRQYNTPLAFELKNVIYAYRKLRFANVILADFIDTSDVVERSIILNYEYSECKDSIWNDDSSGCAAQTHLESYFKYNDPSPCNAPGASTDCTRSCGLCPISADVAGSSCSSTTDCNSPLYGIYGSSVSGECFREGSQSSGFCLGLNTLDSCDNYDAVQHSCGNASEVMEDLVLQCDSHCSADYQCVDGYCNGEWGICMTNYDNVTTSMDIFSDEFSVATYEPITSTTASKYRSDVDVFRPGDAEADYPEDDSIQCDEYNSKCFFDNLNANPYVASVLGLVLIVIILSLLLCICFSICAPFWCLCDKGCKKSCCKCVYGKKESVQWSSCICLILVMIIITGFAIEGMVFNSKLWSHIFDSQDDNSLRSVSVTLFDDMDNKFGYASNLTSFVTDNVDDVLQSVADIVSDNNTDNVGDKIDYMHHLLTTMATSYESGISLENTVLNPFTLQVTNFTLHCPYCDTIYDTIISVNDTIAAESSNTLDTILSILDESEEIANATTFITDSVSDFDSSIEKILDISADTQGEYNDYMDQAEAYNGEIYVTLTFVFIIFIFSVLPIIGYLLKSKWCFKMNWCLAMCCSVILLLISIPFIFTLTLSADFCVRLDEFEEALPTMDSRLARDILNNSVLNDDATIDYTAQDTLDLIDTCFNGGSVLDVWNLSNILDFSSYREQLEDTLDIDIASYFSIAGLETLQSEINTLSTEEYEAEVDEHIFFVNSISGCQCVDSGVPFDRNNLNPGTQCTPMGYSPNNTAIQYWLNAPTGCYGAFVNASFAVQTENQSLGVAHIKIDAVKQDSNEIFTAYDDILDETNMLLTNIHDITCLVTPLFDEFDQILNDFANCGFMGELYGNFKNVGCVVIFEDFYHIGRAIVIIAFMCLLIVFWSLCLDYAYDKSISDEKYEEKQRKTDNDNDSVEIQCVDPNGFSPNVSTNAGPPGSVGSYELNAKSMEEEEGNMPMRAPETLRVLSNSGGAAPNFDDDPLVDGEDDDSDDNVVDGMEVGTGMTGYRQENEYPVIPEDDDDEYPVVPGGAIVDMDDDENQDYDD